MGRIAFLLLLGAAACGPNVQFESEHLSLEPVSSSYGEAESWSLTEGVAVVLDLKPADSHVTFSADDAAIVRVQETSRRGTFIIMPTAPGTTKLHSSGDSQRVFTVNVKAQP
jgi:hypothetical protein